MTTRETFAAWRVEIEEELRVAEQVVSASAGELVAAEAARDVVSVRYQEVQRALNGLPGRVATSLNDKLGPTRDELKAAENAVASIRERDKTYRHLVEDLRGALSQVRQLLPPIDADPEANIEREGPDEER